jgi:hypothetical protein
MNSPKLLEYNSESYALYKYISTLKIRKIFSEEGDSVINISIELIKSPSDSDFVLKLFFDEAVDIKIGDIEGTLAITAEITDIKSWGLENISYRFHDVESDCLSFKCKNFDFCVEGSKLTPPSASPPPPDPQIL